MSNKLLSPLGACDRPPSKSLKRFFVTRLQVISIGHCTLLATTTAWRPPEALRAPQSRCACYYRKLCRESRIGP